MLKHLHIRDFAVIEELEIEFDAGMTVFTGETGAGKSIIVDALGLVLGDRADSSIIRAQCKSTEITAIFAYDTNPALQNILDEQEIEGDDELLLRRVINRDGRSRAFVNGSTVPVQILKLLGEQLVDIHGQHAHQSLLKRDIQRNLLDEYGSHGNALKQVNEIYQRWQTAEKELAQLAGTDEDRDARLALLQYQVQELEALNPDAGEIEQLEEEFSRLSHVTQLLETSRQVLQELSDDDQSIQTRLNQSGNALQGLLRHDTALSGIIELLENAGIQMAEAVSELNHYCEELELDPERLRIVEERIGSIHDIARKHKVRPEELAKQLELLNQQLQGLQDSEHRMLELEKIRDSALKDFWQAAGKLHEMRVMTAKNLGQAIEKRIQDLGMPGGRFTIDIQSIEKDQPLKNGMDRIDYLVSVNPGQPLQPLNKVASGGELSRISLAIQVIGSKDKGLPTLVFDEVDSGIGGGVAEIVGQLLHSLAGNRQVFCVTHLPQVAALGDHHLQVNKSTHAGTTLTQVLHLLEDERIDEIARMLGGLKITAQSRAHAREMLHNKAASH
ncbi:MAG TPA: DNA repair protein RecN [Gammaproteobacteria bacterium]|nr:DNA repair protein RecN [Gammaproteobacteria bacterium]